MSRNCTDRIPQAANSDHAETTSEKQHLYLVDGSAYIFRAYHRLPPLTNPEGTPVGAVYGYTTMLWKLADDLDKADGPTHLAVILDKSSHSFRNDIYPEYKANRPPPPEDLTPQFPLIRDATRAFSLPCIEEEGLEADDLIATYTRAATARGWDVTIVSSDKDLMQLVGTDEAGGGSVDMLDTMKSARIGVAEVEEKFGVAPDSGRRRAGADGRFGRQYSRRVWGRPENREQADPGTWRPDGGAGCRGRHEEIQAEGTPAGTARTGGTEPGAGHAERRLRHARNARQFSHRDGIPPEPLAAFLETHGFSSLLRRLDTGRGSPERRTDLNPAKEGAGRAGWIRRNAPPAARYAPDRP